MKCHEAIQIMVRQLREEVSPEDRDALRDHCEACLPCQAKQEELRHSADLLLTSALPPSLSDPADVLRQQQQVMARLQSWNPSRGAAFPKAPLHRRLLWAGGLATGIALAGGIAVRSWNESRPAPRVSLAKNAPVERPQNPFAAPAPRQHDPLAAGNSPSQQRQAENEKRVSLKPKGNGTVLRPHLPATVKVFPKGHPSPENQANSHIKSVGLKPPAPMPPKAIQAAPSSQKTQNARRKNPTSPSTFSDEMAYLNMRGRDIPEPPRLSSASETNERDDFITIPRPQIASADLGASLALIAQAAKEYEDEKKVVDDRLSQKIDLEFKGGELKDLVALLQQKTKIVFSVDPALQHYKLTLLVQDQPLREIMRQMVRLFNLQWLRYPEKDSYRYELSQSLEAKLDEESLVRKEDDEMLLNVVNELKAYQPYLNTSKEELNRLDAETRTALAAAKTPQEREPLLIRQRLLENVYRDDIRDGVDLFGYLTHDELVSLRNGDEITLEFDGSKPDNRLPKAIAERRLKNDQGEANGHPIKTLPLDGMQIEGRFHFDRSQPDKVNLVVNWEMSGELVDKGQSYGVGSSSDAVLAEGLPDRLKDPGNRQAHPASREPGLDSPVTLNPQTELPLPSQRYAGLALRQPENFELPIGFPNRKDWIDSSDFFAEMHRKTGWSILSDYYTRAYPITKKASDWEYSERNYIGDNSIQTNLENVFHAQNKPLLDTLNDAADALKSGWVNDDHFLRFRRFNYPTERTLDISSDLLNKWSRSKEKNGYLTLDDMAEIASLPDSALNNSDLERAVRWKCGLEEEWRLARETTNALRLYAALTPEQRQRAASDQGLILENPSPQQIQQCLKALHSDRTDVKSLKSPIRFYLHLKKPGVYELNRLRYDIPVDPVFPDPVIVSAASKEEAVEKTRALLQSQGAKEDEIQRAITNIVGPDPGLWAQLQVGKAHALQYSSRMGGSSGSALPSSDFY